MASIQQWHYAEIDPFYICMPPFPFPKQEVGVEIDIWKHHPFTHHPAILTLSMQLRWCWPSLPPSPQRLKFFQMPSIFIGSRCHSQEITLSWNSHNSQTPPLSGEERADLFLMASLSPLGKGEREITLKGWLNKRIHEATTVKQNCYQMAVPWRAKQDLCLH